MTFSDAEPVRQAMMRAATRVDRELRRGLDGLATVAATAPFLGMLATVVGIMFSFTGCGGEKTACMAAFVGNLSNAIAPTAWSLIVAVPALAGHRYLRSQADLFDLEMENASADLLGRLVSPRR